MIETGNYFIFPEDCLQGPKHIGGASKSNKNFFMITCAVGWIKYCKGLVGQSTARNVTDGIFPLICSRSHVTLTKQYSSPPVALYASILHRQAEDHAAAQFNSMAALFPMNLYLVYGSGAFQNRPTTNFPLVSS